MSESNVVEASIKKVRSASRHNKMHEGSLFHFINSTPKEELEKVDFKKDKGVLFLKTPNGNRESYTEKMLERLRIPASGEPRSKIEYMLARIKAVNSTGSSPEELFNRTVTVAINSRNHSALVPAVGTLFGMKEGGIVFVTYESGKVTITSTPPASPATAEHGGTKKAAK